MEIKDFELNSLFYNSTESVDSCVQNISETNPVPRCLSTLPKNIEELVNNFRLQEDLS